MSPTVIELAVVHTPIDALTLAAKDGRLCLVHFGAKDSAARATLQRWYPGETIERRRASTSMSTTFGFCTDAREISIESGTSTTEYPAVRSMSEIRTASAEASLTNTVGVRLDPSTVPPSPLFAVLLVRVPSWRYTARNPG
jgi:hypothetical protein